MLYLDYNATRPLVPDVLDALACKKLLFGNSSSVHSAGRMARKEVENSRSIIAEHLNIAEKRVIFTSGATESNNMIIKGFKGPVIISAIEHDSVFLAKSDLNICRVLNNGIVDLNHLEELLRQINAPCLVSIVAAHNETGIIQPIEDAFHLTKKYGGYFHTDAVQGIGRINAPWHLFDYISVSGHKLGALSGSGILVINETVPLIPLITGGGQERSYRSGTENLFGILSLGVTFPHAMTEDWSKAKEGRDYLENAILSISPKSTIIGKNIDRLPNTTLISMPGVQSATQVISFDLKEICVSAGSACSSGKVKVSRTLKMMNLEEQIASSTLRLSLGPDITKEQLDYFIDCWKNIYEKGKK